MESQNFEENLLKMTKPEVSQLKHQDMLSKAITNAKDKSVMSWWWLSTPLYIIAALLMKSVFMPQTTLLSNIQEFAFKEKYLAILIFLILPVIFIFLNFISIRKIYFLSGSPKSINFMLVVWYNILIIVVSIIVLIIYAI